MNSKLVCVQDYEKKAQKLIPQSDLAYYASGATEELTLRENKLALQRYYIRPRFLRDVSQRDLSTTILGHKVQVPFGVAPTAMQKMAHPSGECANAKAAAKIGAPFTLSTIATCSLEEVALAAPGSVRLFQLYVYKDRAVTAAIVKRAEAAGYAALALTVDAPYFGIRWDNIRNKFALPSHLRLANFEVADNKSSMIRNAHSAAGALNCYVESMFDASISWKDVKWLKSITHLPIVLKGILTAEDAMLAVEAGADAIWVSNHGARQLDSVPSTIEALVEISKAVKGRCEIYVDGGFQLGTDVLKALALGANMVFMGRPLIWGLACDGEQGAYNVLQIVKDELDSAMALSGCCTVNDITTELVIRKEHYAKL